MNEDPASALFGLIRIGKRGRPKGISKQRQKLQSQVRNDLAWLGLPTNELEKWLPGAPTNEEKWLPGEDRRRDLFKFLAASLSDPDWRGKRLIDLDERKKRAALKIYGDIKERTLYREIALMHRRIWGSGLK